MNNNNKLKLLLNYYHTSLILIVYIKVLNYESMTIEGSLLNNIIH